MDPLSTAASIIGILAAAGKVVEIIGPIAINVKDTPRILTALHTEVTGIQVVLSSLQRLLDNLSDAPPARTSLIRLDQVIITLTDAVLAFSELQSFLQTLGMLEGQSLSISARLRLAINGSTTSNLVSRLQGHKATLSLMLNIMQCQSDQEALSSHRDLHLQVQRLVEYNTTILTKLRNLEDSYDAHIFITRGPNLSIVDEDGEGNTIASETTFRTLPSTTQEPLATRYAFEDDLETSRVYKGTDRNTCDRSFTTSVARTHAWSAFTELSMADISVISVIALPIYAQDISNPEHYCFDAVQLSQNSNTTASANQHTSNTPSGDMKSGVNSPQQPREALEGRLNKYLGGGKLTNSPRIARLYGFGRGKPSLKGNGGTAQTLIQRNIDLEGISNDNWPFEALRLPLVEQVRKTRICKRLEDSRDKTEFWIPALPWRCIDFLNHRGCDQGGIYQIPGRERDINLLERKFDTRIDIDLFQYSSSTDPSESFDIYVVASLFKRWLRNLPDEILPRSVQQQISDQCRGASTTPQLLKDEISKLPPQNYYLLFALTCHLALLHSCAKENNMEYRNLYICFQICTKIDSFCFQFLILDWRNCWQGCWTEKEYLEKELQIERTKREVDSEQRRDYA